MRLAAALELPTPAPVLAAAFSPDGDRLAYAGGHRAGGGHLGLLAVSRALPERPSENLLAPLVEHVVEDVLASPLVREGHRDAETARKLSLDTFSISGLHFDGSGTYLAASAWKKGQRYYPTLLFRTQGGVLRYAQLYVEDQAWLQAVPAEDDDAADGVLLVDRHLVVHRRTRKVEHCFHAFPLPEDAGELSGAVGSHSASLAPFPSGGVAAGSSPMSLRPDALRVAKVVAPGALEATELETGEPRLIHALSTHPGGQELVTGSSAGTITFWRPRGDAEDLDRQQVISNREWPAAITALCHLDGGEFLVSADQVGRIVVWKERKRIFEFLLPELRPRALAAAPDRRLLAVGGESLENPRGPGRLFLLEVR